VILGAGSIIGDMSLQAGAKRSATVVALTELVTYKVRGSDLCRCAVLCCAVLCCAVLCCAVLCCAVLCCAVLCAVLRCAVLCCAVLRS